MGSGFALRGIIDCRGTKAIFQMGKAALVEVAPGTVKAELAHQNFFNSFPLPLLPIKDPKDDKKEIFIWD